MIYKRTIINAQRFIQSEQSTSPSSASKQLTSIVESQKLFFSMVLLMNTVMSDTKGPIPISITGLAGNPQATLNTEIFSPLESSQKQFHLQLMKCLLKITELFPPFKILTFFSPLKILTFFWSGIACKHPVCLQQTTHTNFHYSKQHTQTFTTANNTYRLLLQQYSTNR